MEFVSATWGSMSSMSMPNSSAAMMARDAREPPMSGLPVTTLTLPSSATFTVALDCMPPLNQKPHATPRPWFSPRGAL